MRGQALLFVLGIAGACAAGACGGTTNATIPDAGDDGGDDSSTGGHDAAGGDGSMHADAGDDSTQMDGPVDMGNPDGPYGAPSSTYPAFTPEMGQLVTNGGPHLTSPVVVTITWSNDDATSVSTFEGFGDGLGGSMYWSTAVSEYGVGPTTSGAANHVHVATAAAAAVTDADLQNFLQQNAGSTLPAATSQTIYVMYLPSGTSLQFNGSDACQQGVGGYHQGIQLGGNASAYAVIPRCGGGGSMGDQTATLAASHEIGEASTDPQPNSGLFGFDDAHIAFDYWYGFNAMENGDACEFFKSSFYLNGLPFQYAVQRLWSNKSGAAGHAPCAPVPASAYFNVTPLDLQDITIDLSQLGGPAQFATKGYHAAVGGMVTFPIGFYSDAATTPFTVTAESGNSLIGQPTTRLTLSIDPNKTSGVNGEKTYVTAKVNSTGTTKGELLTLITTRGQQTSYMPVLIGSM
jgi:hypothetical protein